MESDLNDDINGEWLPAEMVTGAKVDELTDMNGGAVWTQVPVERCFKATGQRPISVRWVVHNKGDVKHPNVRARLVARRIREKYGGKDVDDLFAAMPPFEAVRLLLTKCVQSQHVGNRRKLMFIDISKARLYAPVDDDTEAYVDLPPECHKPGVCGRLNFWLYGMRPASRGWDALRFDLMCVVHGDDFVFEGNASQLKTVAINLAKHWIVKVRATLGPEAADDKEVSVLNRIIR